MADSQHNLISHSDHVVLLWLLHSVRSFDQWMVQHIDRYRLFDAFYQDAKVQHRVEFGRSTFELITSARYLGYYRDFYALTLTWASSFFRTISFLITVSPIFLGYVLFGMLNFAQYSTRVSDWLQLNRLNGWCIILNSSKASISPPSRSMRSCWETMFEEHSWSSKKTLIHIHLFQRSISSPLSPSSPRLCWTSSFLLSKMLITLPRPVCCFLKIALQSHWR